MAFVFETERDQLFKLNENPNLGPGQYLPLTEFKFNSPDIVPFGVSTNRKFIGNLNQYPGPGSYYRDTEKEKYDLIKENSMKNVILKEDVIFINKKGISDNDPQQKEQQIAMKKLKENYEILGFSSKVKRFANRKKLNTPGPGTYDDSNFNNAKMLEKKCYDNKAVIFNTNVQRNKIFQVEKNENDEKKTKKKDKIISKDKTQIKKDIKMRLEKEQSEIKNDVKYRVSSIPSKNNKGYLIEESTGKVFRKTDPEAFRIFSGDKDDMVGPGSYELIFPEDWKKTGTSWSKYKWQKNPKKIRPKSCFNVNSVNCELGNYRKKNLKSANKNNVLNSKELKTIYKSYTTKQLNFKDPTAHNIDTITEVMKKKKLPIFIPMNNVPGPGFYYDEILQSGMRKASARPIVEKKLLPYEDEVNKSENNKQEVGPGYYFQEEPGETFKKKILNKINKKDIPFLSKSERFQNIKQNYSDTKKNKHKYTKSYYSSYDNNKQSGLTIKNMKNKNIQNLSYEQSNYSSTNNSSSTNVGTFLLLRPQSMAGTFYRKDIRFREREIEENSKKYVPGPGSYINPFTNTGQCNSVQINGRYTDLRTCKKYLENNRTVNKRPKTANFNEKKELHKPNPGVGTYEPDKTFTIKYDIMSKTKKNGKAFNSTLLSDRNAIYQFQKNAPNGPGSHYVDKFFEKQQIPAAFNSTSIRFEVGGKNNTRELYDIDLDVINRKDFNAFIGVYNEDFKGSCLKSDKKNSFRNKNSRQNKSDLKAKFNKGKVGPGTYDYIGEVYPWVKPSFNAKYA